MPTWDESSEIVAGLVLEGRISKNAVRPEIFIKPYDNLMRYLKEGGYSPEELIDKVGLYPYQAAVEAANTINGVGDTADWLAILETSSLNYDAGRKLEKFSRKLQQGEDVDWSKLAYLTKRATDKKARDLIPLSKVESGEVPFIPTGWPSFDEHTAGIPEAGLIIVGGNPGVGKTTFGSCFTSRFVKRHPNKSVVFFSIEMFLSEIARRFREVEKLSLENQERILLCEVPVIPEEALNIAATVNNVGLIVVDFADLMIRGETTESSMAHIYRTLTLGAKELHCPIMLLAQLNRYHGGLPRPQNLRYTGLAEALSWMILMLYNPATDWYGKEEKEELLVVDNTAYVIVWKVRGGFRKHMDEAPGAIRMPFRGDKGWGKIASKSKWVCLKRDE